MPNHSALHPWDVVSEWLTRVPGRRAVQTEGELGVGSGSSHPLEHAEAPRTYCLTWPPGPCQLLLAVLWTSHVPRLLFLLVYEQCT